jgi:hypothetical protein
VAIASAPATAAAAANHISTRRSCQETPVPFASLSAISGTFNSHFKVLLTFPSWYVFAIGLEVTFRFRLNSVTATATATARRGPYTFAWADGDKVKVPVKAPARLQKECDLLSQR